MLEAGEVSLEGGGRVGPGVDARIDVEATLAWQMRRLLLLL